MYIHFFYKIITCTFIAFEAVIVRYLSGGSSIYIQDFLPIYTIIFFQNFFSLIGVFIILKKNIFKLFITSYILLNFIRIFLNILGIILWYLSLQNIPIVYAVSISFISPIISIFGAIFFLNEKVTFQKIIIIFSSFIGFIFTMRPDYLFSQVFEFNIFYIYPFFSSLCMAISKLIARKLMILKHTPWQLTIYLFFFIFPICLFFSFKYGWHSPKYYHWFWIFCLGFLNILINYFFVKSYIVGEIIALLPFGIATKLFVAGIISFYIFQETSNYIPIFIGLFIFFCNFILVIYNYFFFYRMKII
ncbi:MAG TPA: EamA family transporter [Candidatus Azosocius sp. HAIN]